MDKLRLSEKVLSIRVNNSLYEYLAKYAKDKDTTISDITRQSLELFYYVMPYKQGDSTEDKEIFDMILELHADLDSLTLDLPEGTMYKEIIEQLGDLQQTVIQAIEEHKKAEKEIHRRVEALENINNVMNEEFKEALGKLKKRVLSQFENEIRLEGSSVPSSLVLCDSTNKASDIEMSKKLVDISDIAITTSYVR